jgi:hypothetical protein
MTRCFAWGLCWFVVAIASRGAAEEPAAVDPALPAADEVRRPAGEVSPDEVGWICLIGPQGPQGMAAVGKNLTVCGDAQLRPQSRELAAVPGVGVVAALTRFDDSENSNLVSKEDYGDCEVYLEFLLAQGSNSGVKLQHRYEIQLYDSYGKQQPTARDCGGIYPHWVFKRGGGLDYIDQGVPPQLNAAKPAGRWQALHIVFAAPRFDGEGQKTQHARFVSVVLNEQEIHRDIPLESPTGNASSPLPEVPAAPLFLQLDHGPVAFRDVRIKPRDSRPGSP